MKRCDLIRSPTQSDQMFVPSGSNVKTKQAGENTDLSTEVAGARLERTTFGL